MLNAIRRGASGSIVTTRYPAEDEPAPPAFRGQILLHTDRCVGDGACARVCPSDAIVVTGTPEAGWCWELDDARCVFCGLCAEACPTDAILISQEFELSVRDRAALRARVRFAARPALSPMTEAS
jgi:hydrogenase-4 component H